MNDIKQKQTIEIIKLLDGRYSFENVPQENRMVVIGVTCANTDMDAIQRAKKANPNFDYVVVPEKNDD